MGRFLGYPKNLWKHRDPARSRYEVVKSHWSTGHLHSSTWRQQVEQCGWVCPELSVAGSVFSIDQTVGEMGSTIWRDSITQTRTKPPWMICHGKWIADLDSARNTRSGAPLPSWAGNGFARNFGVPPNPTVAIFGVTIFSGTVWGIPQKTPKVLGCSSNNIAVDPRSLDCSHISTQLLVKWSTIMLVHL
jgi:hypothetical protein